MNTGLTKAIQTLADASEELTLLVSDTGNTVVITTWEATETKMLVLSVDVATGKAEQFFFGLGSKKQCIKRATRQHQAAVLAARQKGQAVVLSKAVNDNRVL